MKYNGFPFIYNKFKGERELEEKLTVGLSPALIANTTSNLDQNGCYISGIANASYGKFYPTSNGVFISGLANYAKGGGKGIFVSGGVNSTGELGSLDGIVVSGLGNLGDGKGIHISTVNSGSLKGLQVGFLANDNDLEGINIAGIINCGEYDLEGINIAGIINYASSKHYGDGLKGVSLAGVVNYSNNELTGLSLAPLNIARYVKKFAIQIGVFNYIKENNPHIEDRSLTIQIGLINRYVNRIFPGININGLKNLFQHRKKKGK